MTMRKIEQAGFTGEMVARVAVTGMTTRFRGWNFDINNLMRRTKSSDWTFGYMSLKPAAADRIAAEIREEMPWTRRVYDGEVMLRNPGESVPTTSALAVPLSKIGQSSLSDIPAGLAARVVRRIVDSEALNPRLEVAAFNSAQ